MIAFVLGLTFILLMLVFRSLVVPITAIVMNLLSVGAAYGMLVLVFQMGIGHQLFGFQQAPIESWVPLFLFCILFGLSMDYHVFLLSRIREHYDRTDKSREAVAVGLKATSRIITGAALIMVVVFATFAAGDLAMLQQVGFGLAVAVAPRRDAHPLGPGTGDDGAARAHQLVPAPRAPPRPAPHQARGRSHQAGAAAV